MRSEYVGSPVMVAGTSGKESMMSWTEGILSMMVESINGNKGVEKSTRNYPKDLACSANEATERAKRSKLDYGFYT